MSVEYKHLKISEEIIAGTFVAETYTPPAGIKRLELGIFAGDAAFSTSAVIMVAWDYGTINEKCIWTTKGTNLPHDLQEIINDADGVKKIAVICDNSEANDIFMSAHLDMRIIT